MRARNAKIIKLLSRRQKDLTVFMDEVHKPHNLAAIIRTCDAVGVGNVHAVYPEKKLKECRNTAQGSNRWVTVQRYGCLDEGLTQIKSQGMQILAAHFSEDAVDFRQVDYTIPTCLLVGSEKFGVSQKAAESADKHLVVPMMGMVQSLNVSVALAVLLYEAQRQREIAGLYSQRQISLETFTRLRFEWLHPKVKDFCIKHNLRYPILDDNGDICDDDWQQLRKSAIS